MKTYFSSIQSIVGSNNNDAIDNKVGQLLGVFNEIATYNGQHKIQLELDAGSCQFVPLHNQSEAEMWVADSLDAALVLSDNCDREQWKAFKASLCNQW
ncbi:hypothetical protein MIDIC_70048 [Alphaproteobacteria bacterium]